MKGPKILINESRYTEEGICITCEKKMPLLSNNLTLGIEAYSTF